MTYTEYIKDYLENQDQGTPIYTEEIADAVAEDYKIDKKKAAAATAVALKRIMDNNKLPDLRCYQKGIYFRTASTPFGEMGISREKLIANKYLKNDSGYESGFTLLHHMGLTTQMPTERLLVTNAVKECVRYDRKLGVSVCPPKTPVNKDNKAYLQILDALDCLEKAPIDVQNPYMILAHHIRQNGLKYETLLYFADRYYNQKTIIRLAHTASQKSDRI